MLQLSFWWREGLVVEDVFAELERAQACQARVKDQVLDVGHLQESVCSRSAVQAYLASSFSSF